MKNKLAEALLSEYEGLRKKLRRYHQGQELTTRQKHLILEENRLVIKHEKRNITEQSTQKKIDGFLDLISEYENWRKENHPNCTDECYELSEFEKLLKEGYSPQEARDVLGY